MDGEVGGLYPTPVRVALLKAIRDGGGRVYFEAGEVWDHATGWKVTDKVRRMEQAGWIRALSPDEPRGPGELANPRRGGRPPRTYYRLTELGRTALNRK